MPKKPTLKRGLSNRPCKSCGNSFKPYRRYHRFCSTRCRALFWRTKNRSISIAIDSIADHEKRLRVIEAKLGINVP